MPRQKGPYRRVVRTERRGEGVRARHWLVLECGHEVPAGHRTKRGSSRRVTCQACDAESEDIMKQATKQLRKEMGFAPLTPKEAEAAYEAAPSVPVSPARVKEIVAFATSTTTRPSDVIGEAQELLLTGGALQLDKVLEMIRGARGSLEGHYTNVHDKAYQSKEIAGALHELGRAEGRLRVFAHLASSGAEDIDRIFRSKSGDKVLSRAKTLCGRLRAFKRAFDSLSHAQKLAWKKGL